MIIVYSLRISTKKKNNEKDTPNYHLLICSQPYFNKRVVAGKNLLRFKLKREEIFQRMLDLDDISVGLTTKKEKERIACTCHRCSGVTRIEGLEKGHRTFWQSLFSFHKREGVYTCSRCGAPVSYSEREAIKEAIAEKEEYEYEIQRLYASTLTSCLAHIALFEKSCSEPVEKQIWKIRKSFAGFDDDINEALAKVRASANPEDIVYPALRHSSQKLTPGVMMQIIARCAKILDRDCDMGEKAETLIKEYMLVCGIPKNKYEEIMNLKMEV